MALYEVVDLPAKYLGLLASLYDADSAWHDYGAECRFVEAALRSQRFSQGARLLDLCCGTGSHALVLAQKGHHVTGIDASPRMVELATEKSRTSGLARWARFRRGSVLSLPPIGDRFDGAYMMGLSAILDFLYGNLLRICAAVESVLRPGGFFIFDLHVGTTHPHTPPRGAARYRVGTPPSFASHRPFRFAPGTTNRIAMGSLRRGRPARRGTAPSMAGDTRAALRIREERHPEKGYRIYRYDWTIGSGNREHRIRAWERLRMVRDSELAKLMDVLEATGSWESVELRRTEGFKAGYRIVELRKHAKGGI